MLRVSAEAVGKMAVSCQVLPWRCGRCGAARLVLVAPDEWARNAVRVKTLDTRDEVDVDVDQLC